MEEMVKDTAVDSFTIRDVQMKLPAIKHKWIGRLMRAKMKISEISRLRSDAISVLAEKLIKESPVQLSIPVAERKVKGTSTIVKFDSDIKDLSIIIEYLEKVEKVFSSMTFDIRNVTEIMKLETT